MKYFVEEIKVDTTVYDEVIIVVCAYMYLWHFYI